jgi:hypothetical protein
MLSRISPHGLLLLAALLTGCVTTETPATSSSISDEAAFAMARRTIRDDAKDPAAVQIGPKMWRRTVTGSTFGDGPQDVVCGTVNEKNALGGYTGFAPFMFNVGDVPLAAVSTPVHRR